MAAFHRFPVIILVPVIAVHVQIDHIRHRHPDGIAVHVFRQWAIAIRIDINNDTAIARGTA